MLQAIQQSIDQLPRIRRDRGLWIQYDFCAMETDYGIQDASARQRLQLLIALQYHATDDDESLIRHLLQQETIARQHDSFQGYGEALELAAYLLATFRRPADIWLFAEAKGANFDTLCGFSPAFFLFCGQQLAINTVSKSEHELKSFVLEYLLDESQTPRYDESDIDQQWQHLVHQFPRDPADEDAMVWVDRAIAMDELEAGRTLLANYEQEHPESRKDHSFDWKQLGDYGRAVVAKQLELADVVQPWDRVSKSTALADLYVLNQQPHEAWQLVEQCDPLLEQIDGWQEVGLGRTLVESAFDIAIQMDAEAVERPVVYQWACRRFDELVNRSLMLIEKAVTAAKGLADQSRAAQFQLLADQEQREIDRMLKR